MINLVKRFSNKIGIDGTIAYTLFSRVIQGAGGVFTVIFIAKFLTKTEQGYYYTFGSILAIQVFFELGLTNIITQFVAHENANLIWHNHKNFSGLKESISRLASLLRFTVKWFAVISLFLFFGLIITGYFFFNKYGKEHVNVEWNIPWIILSITTSLSLMVSPILAFFEGLGSVKEVARIRMTQQVIQISFVLILFSFGFKLYSAPVAAIISFLTVPFWIFFGSKINLLIFIWNKLGDWHVNYRMEIFPYQWKIALSWISGYFIFQLFNPVLFATEGAIIAGKMGMTLTVLNSIMALSLSWMTTKVPIFSVLISKKDYVQLDHLFNKALLQSSVLNVCFLVVMFCLVVFFQYFEITIGGKKLGDSFLPYLPMLLMMITIFLNHVVASWATYMRCHKREPMLIQSIVIGLFCSISTLTLGNYFGLMGITSGYLTLSVIGFIWTYFIFKTKKKQWHT